MSEQEKRLECSKCVGYCCTFMQIPLPPSHMKRDIVRWLNLHEGIEVKGKFLHIENKCSKLLPDGKCGIYETRPLLCVKGDGRDLQHRNLCKKGYEMFRQGSKDLNS